MATRFHELREASSPAVRTGFFCFVALMMLGAAPRLDAQIVHEVVVTGCPGLGAAEAAEAFGLSPGTKAESSVLSAAGDRLIARFRENGFLHARIDSIELKPRPESVSVDVVIGVHEGLPAVVRRISWPGAIHVTSERTRDEPSLQAGERFSVIRLEADIDAVLRAYDDAGFAMARASVDSVTFIPSADAESVDVVVRVAEGDLACIGSVSVEGNRTTRTDVIVREMRLKPEEVFRPALADAVRKRLTRMRIFTSVSQPEMYLDEHERTGMLLRVTEGAANSFDGIVGYLPASHSGGSGTVTGMVHLQFRNLFGTARRLAVRWYREDRSSQEVELQYREPWVASLPLNADAGLFQRQQDSTFVRLELSLATEAMISDRLFASLSLDQTNVYPTEGYGRTVMAANRSLAVAAGLRYDFRDDPVTPTDGAIYETTYELGTKRVDALGPGPATRFATQRIAMNVAAYVPVARRQVFEATLHVRDRQTPSPDPSDLERLGGAATLRGYREGQFAGTRLVWGGLEYRLLAGHRSFVYGFVDAGYVSLPSALSSGGNASDLSRTGFGVGIRLDTDLGLIGVSLAFGQGDSFSTSKLHVRIANDF